MNHSQASAENCFGGYSLERAAAQREDQAWLRKKLRDPTTRLVALHDSRNLFDDDQAPLFLAPGAWEEDWLETLPVVFLCEEENTAYFAVDFTEADLKITQAAHRPGEFKDLKAQAALLAARDAALLAYARAMAHWHRTHQFCGACSARTESLSAGHMRRCLNSACAREHFPRTDPAVIVLVLHGEHALLARQEQWPPLRFSTLAGFVEPGETLEAAVAREVAEETGVRLERIWYHSSQPWPFPSSLMLGFFAQARSKDLRLNSAEISEALWLTRAELRAAVQACRISLPTEISIAYRLVQEWLDT